MSVHTPASILGKSELRHVISSTECWHSLILAVLWAWFYIAPVSNETVHLLKCSLAPHMWSCMLSLARVYQVATAE